MSHELARIMAAVMATPWAMEESRIAEMRALLERRSAQGPASEDEIRARLELGPSGYHPEAPDLQLLDSTAEWISLPSMDPPSSPETEGARTWRLTADHLDKFAEGGTEAAARPRARAQGAVAVVRLFGVISNRIHSVERISGPGGTSAERFANNVRTAAGNAGVKAIVLDMDTPGGTVEGVAEAADAVWQARQTKHVVAVANAMAYSAGYWIGSQADEFVVTPSGGVGSIGFRTAHVDESEALAAKGLKVTVISAGKFKDEGLPFGPLSEEALVAIRGRVEAHYATFTQHVARGRGVKPADVRGGFGRGRAVVAAEAVKLGLADRVAEMGDVMARLGAGPGQAASAEAAPMAGPTQDNALALMRHRLRAAARR